MASTTHFIRARTALLGFALSAMLLLAAASGAWAEDGSTGTTGATGATGDSGRVTQLGADPTVRVAKRKHCVSRGVTVSPTFTGGGGVTASYLYVNGREVAKRKSAGSLRVSVSRLQHGVNSFELISEFADGRAASVVGQIRRCG